MTSKIKISEKGKNKKYFWMNIWNGQNHAKMMEVNVNLTPKDLDDLEQQIKNVKKINRRDYFKEFFLQRRYLGSDFGDYFRITDLGKRFIIKYDENDFKKLKLNERVKVKNEFNIMMEALENIDKILSKSLKIKKDPETDDPRKDDTKYHCPYCNKPLEPSEINEEFPNDYICKKCNKRFVVDLDNTETQSDLRLYLKEKCINYSQKNCWGCKWCSKFICNLCKKAICECEISDKEESNQSFENKCKKWKPKCDFIDCTGELLCYEPIEEERENDDKI